VARQAESWWQGFGYVRAGEEPRIASTKRPRDDQCAPQLCHRRGNPFATRAWLQSVQIVPND